MALAGRSAHGGSVRRTAARPELIRASLVDIQNLGAREGCTGEFEHGSLSFFQKVTQHAALAPARSDVIGFSVHLHVHHLAFPAGFGVAGPEGSFDPWKDLRHDGVVDLLRIGWIHGRG